MPIHITCPNCGKSYNVPDGRAGQNGNCSCGTSIPIPAPPRAAAPPPPSPVARPMQAPPPARPVAPQASPFTQQAPNLNGAPDLGGPPDLGGAPDLGGKPGYQPPVYNTPQQSPYQQPPNPYAAPTYPSTYQPGGFGNRVYSSQVQRPTLLTVMIILGYIGCGFLGLMGVLMAVAGGAMAPMMSQGGGQGGGVFGSLMAGGVVVFGIIIVALAGFSVYVLISLWRGRNWARIVSIVFAGLAILNGLWSVVSSIQMQQTMASMGGSMGAPSMLPAAIGGAVVGLLINGLWLYALLMPDTVEYCRQ